MVLVALGPLAIPNPLENALLDEPAKTVGKHVAGDAETLLELVEVAKAEEGVADDQQRPALADDLEGTGDRALLSFVVTLEHATKVAERFITQLDFATLAAISFVTQLTEEEMVR